MADYRTRRKNDRSTLFAIASLTKPLTGILTDRLIEAGKLSGTDPIAKWIPDFPRASEITVDILRQHRSGLPLRVTTLEEELQGQSPESMVRIAARKPLRFTPGSQYLYSSTGYTVLARILELATGAPYEVLLQDYVLVPSGVTDAFSRTVTTRLPSNVAHGYFRSPAGPSEPPARNLSFLTGAGSVYATPRDLFLITRAIAAGKLDQDHAEAMRQGLYWNGITNGYRAFLQYFPQTGITLIWTSNLYTGAGDLLRRDVPRILAGAAVPAVTIKMPTPVAVSADEQRVLEGSYEFGAASFQQLRFISPTLAMLGTEYLLIPVAGGAFYSPADYATLTAEHDAGGAITALRWVANGTTLSFPRLRP
jgi:CubicO group peptidase (beta-lactamase class C family)